MDTLPKEITSVIVCECDVCGREDVALTNVRKGVWYCNKHLPLFTKHWTIAPHLFPFELEST